MRRPDAEWICELTVDGDLGISGRDAHPRDAYKELVGRVCLGEVGAIFGLEVSRLARSSAETQPPRAPRSVIASASCAR